MAVASASPPLIPLLAALAGLAGQDIDPIVSSEPVAPGVAGPFRISAFATDLAGPEWMTFGADGNLYVTLRSGGVVSLQDADGDGRAEVRAMAAPGPSRYRGIAWRDDELWVTDGERVLRVRPDAADPIGPPTEVPVRATEGEVFGPLRFAGGALLIAVAARDTGSAVAGSGYVLRYDPSNGEAEVWARGLREPTGLALDPETGELWVVDAVGEPVQDPVEPAEVNIVARGRHYGWPYCYGSRMPHPAYSDTERCDLTEPPLLMFPGGTNPAGLSFYAGTSAPVQYRGDVLLALRGSARLGVAPRVIRIRLDGSRRPIGIEPFMDGWWAPGGEIRGEPVQSLVGPEGALYVSDALGRTIWRIVPAESAIPRDATPAGRR